MFRPVNKTNSAVFCSAWKMQNQHSSASRAHKGASCMYIYTSFYLSFLVLSLSSFLNSRQLFAVATEMAATPSAHREWDFVKRVQLHNSNLHLCEETCALDEHCVEWYLMAPATASAGIAEETITVATQFAVPGSQSNNAVGSDSHTYDCFLVSKTMVGYISATPQAFSLSERAVHGKKAGLDENEQGGGEEAEEKEREDVLISGDAMHYLPTATEATTAADDDTQLSLTQIAAISSATSSKNSRRSQFINPLNTPPKHARAYRLLRGPIATDSTTMLNYHAHFVRGCPYTISLWIWLWRPKTPYELYKFQPIISTRPTYPPLTAHEPFLPAILFNVGRFPDQFFVAGQLDTRGDYSGFFPKNSPVRYHEWIHFVLTVQGNRLKVYIDGEYKDYVELAASTQRCPYQSATMKDWTTTKSTLFSDKNSTNGEIEKMNSERMGSTDSWDRLVNNTILQVSGARRKQSTPGLLKDVTILSNHALSAHEIQQIWEISHPPRLPTLYRLLLGIKGVHTFHDFCPIRVEESPYLMYLWGLCPAGSYCAKRAPDGTNSINICVNERVFFEPTLQHTGSASRSMALASYIRIQWNSDSALLPKNALSDGQAGIMDMPAIGELSSVGQVDPRAKKRPSSAKSGNRSSKAPLLEDIFDLMEENDGFLASFGFKFGAFSVHDVVDMLVFPQKTAFRFVLRVLGILPTEDISKSSTEGSMEDDRNTPLHSQQHSTDTDAQAAADKNARASASSKNNNNNNNNIPFSSRALKNSTTRSIWKEKTETQKVQALYKAAMIWMHGRHESTMFDMESLSLDEWMGEMNEKSFSALVLALWMSGDLQTEQDADVEWSFRYPSILSQPIHMALGYKAAVRHTSEVITPEIAANTNKRLANKLLGGVTLSHLLDGKDSEENVETKEGEKEDLLMLQPPVPSLLPHLHGEETEPMDPSSLSDSSELGRKEEEEKEEETLIQSRETTHNDNSGDDSITERDRGLQQQQWRSGTARKLFLAFSNVSESDLAHTISRAVLLSSLQGIEEANAELVEEEEVEEMAEDVTAMGEMGKMGGKRVDLDEKDRFLVSLQRAGLSPTGREVRALLTNLSAHIFTFSENEERDEMNSLRKRPLLRQNAVCLAPENGDSASSLQCTQFSSSSLSSLPSSGISMKYSVHKVNAVQPFHQPELAVGAGEPECSVAAAYYFPVTQYIASHYGTRQASKINIGVLEEVRLYVSGGKAVGHHGEKDTLHLHTEADAFNGDAAAQTWLGKKYYWGFGGLQRNEMIARRWFELAAEQEEAEGLYNLGCFYLYGRAGLDINPEIAHSYFVRAANAEKPFPMALHAMGNHYLNDQKERNLTEARTYFSRAAKAGSPEGHFSYGAMLLDGRGGDKHVRHAVVHISIAASHKHVRAMNFLAHALFDPDSWLAQHGREEQINARKSSLLHALSPPDLALVVPKNTTENATATAAMNSSAASPESPQNGKFYGGKSGIGSSSSSSSSSTGTAAAEMDWVYNDTAPIIIHTSKGRIALPEPLGSPLGACDAALPLLKHLSEMGYRTKDITKRAMKEYLAGNLWSALELYEEAADLGVESAQENAAYLYELLMVQECEQGSGFIYRDSDPNSRHSAAFDGKAMSGSSSSPSYEKSSEEQRVLADYCRYYFNRMATRRWVQLANSGETLARRKVADRILMDAEHPNPLFSREDDGNERRKLGKEVAVLGERNVTRAALLYGLAALEGDLPSMLSMGWLLHSGGGGVKRNVTAARHLFEQARLRERAEGSQTMGLAPSLALFVLDIEHLLQRHHLYNGTLFELARGAETRIWEAFNYVAGVFVQ